MKLTVVDTLAISEDGVGYEVTSSTGSLRIASGALSASLSLTASAWRKEGDEARTPYSCYFAMYKRKGNTYSRIGYSTSKSTSWSSGSHMIESDIDEVVLVISDSVLSASSFASVLPVSFLAKTSISVTSDGKDGQDGARGYGIMLTLLRDLCYTEGEWSSFAEIGHNEYYSKRTGDHKFSACRVGDYFVVTGRSSDEQLMHTATYCCTSVSSTGIHGDCISHIKEGKKGANGSTGKMCYIAGEYRSDIEYTSNDRQTVAVEVPGSGNTTQLWYLDATTNVINGTHVSPSTTGQTIWKMGLNAYNLIRTKYLFADFAMMGAFVVSGDWLFSTNGTINGIEYNNGANYKGKPAYTWFDSSNPFENHTIVNGQSGYNFIPNYAVDGKTGRVIKDLTYTLPVWEQNSFTITSPRGLYFVGGSNQVVTMPSPADYPALRIEFFMPLPMTRIPVSCKLARSGVQFIDGTDIYDNEYSLSMGVLTTLVSDGHRWYVMT